MLKHSIILVVCLTKIVFAEIDIGSLCFSAFHHYKGKIRESSRRIREQELRASGEMLTKLQYLESKRSKLEFDNFFSTFFFARSGEKGEVGSVYNKQYFSSKDEFKEIKILIEKLRLAVKPITELLNAELSSNIQVHEEVLFATDNYARFMNIFEEAGKISANLSEAMAGSEKQDAKFFDLYEEIHVLKGLYYYLYETSGSTEQMLELRFLTEEKEQEKAIASKNFQTSVVKTSNYANELNKKTYQLFFAHVHLGNSFHAIFFSVFKGLLGRSYSKFVDLQVEDINELRSGFFDIFKVNEELSAKLKEIEGDPSLKEEKLVRLWENELSDFHLNLLRELTLHVNCTTKHFNTNKINLLELLKNFKSFDKTHEEAIDTAFELLTAMNKKVCLSYDHLVHSIINLAYSKIALVLGAKISVSRQKRFEELTDYWTSLTSSENEEEKEFWIEKQMNEHKAVWILQCQDRRTGIMTWESWVIAAVLLFSSLILILCRKRMRIKFDVKDTRVFYRKKSEFEF